MKIRFRYTISGQSHFFDIVPRETGVIVDISTLANVGGSLRGYAIRDFNGVQMVRKNPNYDTYERYSSFPNAMQNAIDFSDAMTITTTNQYYDHSVSENDRTLANGQEMQFDGSAGTATFTGFLKTEYEGGEPVTYAYCGGLWYVTPTTGGEHAAGTSGYANIRIPYNSTPESNPRFDFALVTVQNDTDLIPCLFASVRNRSGQSDMCYLFDLRMFSGSAAKPVTDTNTTTPYGRTGTYNFTSDQMLDVPPTGYSFVNRWEHGLTLYHLNDLQLNAIFSEFWGNETLWQMFMNSTVKQIQGVLCLHKVPVPVASGSSMRALSVFGKRIARGELLESLPLVNSQMIQYPETPAWIPLEEIYGDYFDYAGQSKLSVYLPFVGTVPIDINKVMGGAIKTIYHIDLLTGNLIVRVYGRNAMGNGAEVLLYQGSGNCALHIPYVGNDQGGMKLLGALAGVATAGIATLATGGAGAAPALAAVTGTAGYALAPHNSSVNNVPTEAAPLSYPYVCYIMEYPERLLTALQENQMGFASASGGEGTTVSDYSGFTQGYLHADIAGATDAEKAEIERAFQTGVIL